MYIVFEEHQYEADTVKDVLRGISELQDVDKRVSVSYVGYYYEPHIHDCVFILPKVLLNEQDQLVVGSGMTIDPALVITPKGQAKHLTSEYRKFLYEFAVWIYRTIAVYHQQNRSSQAIYYRHLPQSGAGSRHKANTYLDIILSLIQFNNENQDFFLYVVKNIHSGFNKINWTRTISSTPAHLQDNVPLYLNPVNKKRQINFDEELFVIFFSILNYINDEYGFRTTISLQYELLTKAQFENYRRGYGRIRLREIRYKYFSDKTLLLWDLCYAFFDSSYQLAVNTDNKEYLLAKKYNIIFEAMIDELIGTPHKDIPKGLAEQDDEKRVDHLYTDLALTSSETEKREVYYIGDSKYYKMSTSLGKSSIAKQYTYARNVIQWNIDMWKDNAEGRRMRNETSDEFRRVRLRPDSATEGYDIIPNFFLSADVDEQRRYNRGTDVEGHDLNIHPRIENGEEKTFVQSHFDNRLFDRDSLLLLYYDVNFLFIVRMYARNNAAEKAEWKAKVREIFRKRIQKILADKYHFYALAPKPQTYAEGYMQDNLKVLIGKVYQPFDNPEMYVLALDNEDPQHENAEILQTLGEHFFITLQGAYSIGQDPTAQLQTAGYTQGVDEPVLADEYILLSTIDSKANTDINALINGTAAVFISGYRPSDKVDLQSIKYVGAIFNHKVFGAYQVRSINVAYIENAFRLKFNLGEYHIFRQPIIYGLDKYATPGVALNVAQLSDRAGISPTPKRFSAFFE